tara:strand:- start:622 stop:5292 length:4671 start_codon:yes stop_codon:yes gene_type:complete
MATKLCILPENKGAIYKKIGNKVQKYLANNPGVNTTQLLRSLRNSIAEQPDIGLLDHYDQVIETYYKDNSEILAPYVINTTVNITKRIKKISDLEAPEFINKSIEIVEGNQEENENDKRNELGADDLVHKDNVGNFKIGESGLDGWNDKILSATGMSHTTTEFKHIFRKVKTLGSFDNFYRWMQREYGIYDFNDAPKGKGNRALKIERDLKDFYNAHTERNERTRSSVLELWWTNLDISKVTNYEEGMVEGITGSTGFVRALPYDPNKRKMKSDYVAKSFLDASSSAVRENRISDMTAYFKISSLGKFKKTKKGSWWFEPRLKQVGEATYRMWESALSNFRFKGKYTPFTIVGITPGETGNVILSRILDSQINSLFPKNEIVSKLKSIGMESSALKVEQGLADSVLEWFNDIHQDYSQWQSWVNVSSVVDEVVDGKTKKVRRTIAYQKFGPGASIKWTEVQKRYNAINAALTEVGLKNLVKYLTPQIISKENKKGSMTKDQAGMFYKSAVAMTAKSSHVGGFSTPITTDLGGLIAKHEWLQAARGDNYMTHDNGDTFKLDGRLKLNMSKGFVLENVGDNNIAYFDQDKVTMTFLDPNDPNAETIEIESIRELLGVNYMDGGTLASTNRMKKMASASAAYPLANRDNEFWPKNLKTVTSYVKDEDTKDRSYFERKHAIHEAPAGLTIKNTKTGKVIIETRLWKDEVVIYYKGKPVDEISDKDSVKTASNKYDIVKKNRDSMLVTLPEESERVLSIPHFSGNDTSYGPVQLLSSLNYDLTNADETTQKQFEEYKDTITGILKNQSNIFNEALMNAHLDPRKMRSLLKYVYSQRNEANDDMRSKLKVSGGSAIHHPDYQMRLRSMLLNMLIRKGSLQSRTYQSKINPGDSRGRVGTNLILKPDVNNEVQDIQNVILPASVGGNRVIFNKILIQAKNASQEVDIALKAFDDSSVRKQLVLDQLDEAQWLNDNLIKAVNSWLKNNPQYILAYRSPIGDISHVRPIKIQEVRKDMGNSAIFHPDFVTTVLIGDYDIDEAGVMLIDKKEADTMLEFQETKLFKSWIKDADYSIFETIESRNVADYDQRRQTHIDIINGNGLQGMATNLKSIASTLSMHYNSITLSDGTVVRPKKLTDMVVMDYAPLKADYDSSSIPSFASVTKPDANGNVYLKTTAAHEFLLIINVATDHANKKVKGMMTNKWGLKDSSWFVERMFHVDKSTTKRDGKPALSSMAISLLRKLKDEYSYSRLKKLRTKKGLKMDMGLAMVEMKRIYDMLNWDSEKLQTKMMEKTRIMNKEGSGVAVDILRIDPVLGKDGKQLITPEEQVITSLYETMDNTVDFNAKYPLGHSPNKHRLNHIYTKNQLWDEFKNNPDSPLYKTNYSKEVLEVASKFSQKFRDTFYAPFEKSEAERTLKLQSKKMGDSKDTNPDKSEASIIGKSVDYNEELFTIVENGIIELENLVNKHGEGVREIFTLQIMSGLDDHQNVRMMPTLELNSRRLGGRKNLLSPKVFKLYADAWEQNWVDRTNGVLNATKELETIDNKRTPWGKSLIALREVERKDC